MTRFVIIRMALVAIAWLAAQNSAQATINGDFESGTFTGWRLDLPRYRLNPSTVGSASTLHSWAARPDEILAPVTGDYFIALGTSASGNRRDNRNYNLTLQQRLWLNEGDTVSGWASFFNGDNLGQDAAWVKVFADDGSPLTLWQEHSGSSSNGDLNSTPYLSNTDWTPWQWRAPQDGEFTLMLGMTTVGDDNLASYGFFDSIFVVPAALPVPEPSALALMALGATLLLRGSRRNSSQLR
jgi:hypothetical protein